MSTTAEAGRPFFANIKITPEKAADFGRKLSQDDRFRSEFEQDPEGVLDRYGIAVPRGAIGKPAKLPPKEVMQRILDEADSGPEAFPVFVVFIAFCSFVAFLSE